MSRILWGRFLAVAVVTAVGQAALGDSVVWFGVLRVDLPLLVTVALGFVALPVDAAIMGFTLGLTADLLTLGPFGLNALVLCLAAWALALARQRMLLAGGSFRSAQGAIAAAAVTAAVRMAGFVFGMRPEGFGRDGLLSLGAVAVAGAVSVHLLMPLASRMLRDSSIPATRATTRARTGSPTG